MIFWSLSVPGTPGITAYKVVCVPLLVDNWSSFARLRKSSQKAQNVYVWDLALWMLMMCSHLQKRRWCEHIKEPIAIITLWAPSYTLEKHLSHIKYQGLHILRVLFACKTLGKWSAAAGRVYGISWLRGSGKMKNKPFFLQVIMKNVRFQEVFDPYPCITDFQVSGAKQPPGVHAWSLRWPWTHSRASNTKSFYSRGA